MSTIPETELSGEALAALLLNDVRSFIRRFCVLQDEHAITAVTLWAAHAHMVGHFHTTARLVIKSPEAGSGKTRVLEVLSLLVPEPMLSLNASPAAIFRTLSQQQITLLFDEVDAVFNSRTKDGNHEDLRALLNAGYKRGATIPRCVGPTHEVVHFPVFSAVALAGIGDLPDTIMSRGVIIHMRRRAPGEKVEPFRTRVHEAPGHAIRDRLADWASIVGPAVGEAWPTLPDGIVDRPAEIWEPLIAVADAAGAEWSAIARTACVSMCHSAQDRRASNGVRLLSDLRVIFGDSIALHTETILSRLCHGDAHGLAADAPWKEVAAGRPINDLMLAKMLGEYGVSSLKVKVAGESLRGYRREHLWDSWQRYLPPYPLEAEPLEPTEPSAASTVIYGPAVPRVPQVPPLQGSESVNEPNLDSRVRAMAKRWCYSEEELAGMLARAVRDPAGCRLMVESDELHATFRPS